MENNTIQQQQNELIREAPPPISESIRKMEETAILELKSIMDSCKDLDMQKPENLDFIKRGQGLLNIAIEDLMITNRMAQGVANEHDYKRLEELDTERNALKGKSEALRKDVEITTQEPSIDASSSKWQETIQSRAQEPQTTVSFVR